MAIDCGDLRARLKELDDQIAASEAMERLLAAENAQLKAAGPQPRIRRLKMVDGSYLEIDPQKFWDQVEKDAKELGEADIAAAVSQGFATNARPVGSRGLHINYAQLPPTEDHIAKLLEVLALRRNASEKGVELRRPFTESAATAQVLLMGKAYGADPRALAEAMKRKLAGIDQLPINAYIINRVKRDAVRYYADVLEETADLVRVGGVDASIKDQVANAARWAHYWEQFDNQVSRKIGQALRTRQFGDWVNENIFMQFEKDIQLLSYDEIAGGSLVAQVMEHIEAGDPMKLRRLATAKRLDNLANRSLNEPNFMTQVEILNTYRKDNLFSSAATWLVRNPSSLWTGMWHGVEDIIEGGLKHGAAEVAAANHAARSMLQGMGMGWRNARDNFAYGKKTFSIESSAELSPDLMQEARARITEDLNQSWELMLTPSYHLRRPVLSTAVTFMNLVNLSWRRLLGDLVENATGTSAGFTPAFRLLNGGDEVIRKMAFDWKVNHEAWLRAADEAKTAVDPATGTRVRSAWIRNRAEEMASKAVFSGLMTDDELAKFRLRELGITAGDMDNETLRLQMFNNLHGTPNVADELGKLGDMRAQEVTFTQPLNDDVSLGVQMMRKQPLIGWILPVWRAPANGLKWLISRDMYVNGVRQLLMEAENAAGPGGWMRPGEDMGKFWKAGAVDPDKLAKGRASMIASVALAGVVHQLWSAGIFSDGGPSDDAAREAWLRKNQPYAFSLATGPFLAAKFKVDSIDFFDLMGLQADVARAWHEGRLDGDSWNTLMGGIVTAYGRMFMNKASLEGVTTLLDAITRVGQGDEVDWFDQLAKQTTGILPMSGLLTQASRALNDPNQVASKRRELTPAEYAALQKDPNWETFERITSRIFANYPVLGHAFPQQKEERDWLGRKVQRPLGLPLDLATPYMPVLKGQDPLDDWLEKHGLGMKPRPNGVISEGLPTPTTMTLEQEATYRQAMYSLVGQVPAAAVLGASRATVNVLTGSFSIDNYVQGRTLNEALRKLSQDPDYNLELNTPGGPSLVTQPNRSLSERTKRVNDPRNVYEVFNGVVSYYDRLALQAMVQRHEPEFRAMAEANLRALQGTIRQRLEASPLGLTRQ